jgi:hypothetical protein
MPEHSPIEALNYSPQRQSISGVATRALRLIASWCTAPPMLCHISTRTHVLTEAFGQSAGPTDVAAMMFFLKFKIQQGG